MTLIALTSQDRRKITQHAGQCRNFLLFDVVGSRIGEPRLVELPLGASWHDTPNHEPHALDGVDVLISGSIGDGLRRKLSQRGIRIVITTERSPRLAVQRYLDGTLPVRAEDHPAHEGGCVCRCGHASEPAPITP
jgi:predicted Fe-Mo cluster-binding NifX family protein